MASRCSPTVALCAWWCSPTRSRRDPSTAWPGSRSWISRARRPEMTTRYPFHLSIPVSDLPSAKRFYVEVLGGRAGREREEWLDILVWGHQITLQLQPEEVLPADRQGKRHFGVVFPWAVWEREVERIERVGVGLL